ncbi:acyltransferase family protein [Novosphingobium resinovorum]|uniref:acyltransferase family protein n=1 Tax=Novosphingobium resinovorum TaxID=158500 RepID=UPI002ED5AB97|nr:acyltransferase family protein [Novosphingobium resinovorum]
MSTEKPLEGRLIAFDTLRGVAAFAVVFYHLRTLGPISTLPSWGRFFGSGYLAVDLFFILSGFIIPHAYGAHLAQAMTVREFLIARIIRLQPMMAIGTLLGAFLALVQRATGSADAPGILAIATALPLNMAMLPDVLFPWGIFLFNPPAWSLFYELLANMVFALSIRYLPSPKPIRFGSNITLAVVCLASGLGIAHSAFEPGGLDRGVILADWSVALSRISFSFTFGVLLHSTQEYWQPRVSRVPLPLLMLSCITLLGANPSTTWRAAYDLAFITIASPLLLMLATGTGPSPFFGRIGAWLGMISYPLYAVHAPIKHMIEALRLPNAALSFAVALTIAIVVAWLAARIEPRLQSLLAVHLKRSSSGHDRRISGTRRISGDSWENCVRGSRKIAPVASSHVPDPTDLDPGDTVTAKGGTADGNDISKGNVLFVSRQRMIGRINGSSAYLIDLATAVRNAGFTPHLLQPSPNLMGRWPIMRLRREMAIFESHAIRGVFRHADWVVSRDPRVFLDAVRCVLSRLVRRAGCKVKWFDDRPYPYSIAAPWEEADRTYVRKAAPYANIVIADYAFQAEAFDQLPDRPTAIVMHDLFHRRDPGAQKRDSVAQLGREDEIALLSKADAVIAIQSEEARFITEYVYGAQPILTPMGMRPVSAAQPGIPNRLLFVGSNTAPNVIGLEWFFDNVWPQVREHVPDMRLDVAGTVAAAFSRSPHSGVIFHGLVNDLHSLYSDAAVVIAPLTFGSGLKIKLVEALAYGKAIVATSITLQGIERECADAVIQADDAGHFAQAIISLKDDHDRLNLAEAALDAARRYFSPQACHAEFSIWLENCKPTRAHAQP